ncbi:MAG: Nif3-like dinuclear metal center hexameric protein [Ruminococcaceae bacterium]|nr:Nif3-like dinuclear metal center hexameric protein [Oscillospiraceae bacterium]
MVNAKDIYNYLNDIMPFETQEKWDNSGLLVNCGNSVNKVLCCLDVTKAAVDKAIEENCQLIVSHHPVIFSSIKSLDCGSILMKLIQNNISVISAHTNFDKYQFGTSYRLAQYCGVKGNGELLEFGLAISLEEPQLFSSFVEKIKQKVNVPLQYTNGKENVNRVFVIAGSGKGMTEEIMAAGCDCVITGENSYHDMLDLKELGISCICLGHDESEKISVDTLTKLINDRFESAEAVSYIEESLVKYI